MKIETTKDKVVFTIDRYQTCHGSYGSPTKQDNLVGVVIQHDGHKEMGFAKHIYLGYKDSHQIGDFIVKWHGNREDFIGECMKMEVSIHYLDWEENNKE